MAEQKKVLRLKSQAKEIRKEILTMIHAAQSGHPGGSLSAADMMTALYFDELRLNPENPQWEERDRFVLSKGHACPVLYTCLALRGFFPKEELVTLREEGSILQGHPDMKRCPGVDISTGSLGQGLSATVGMALCAKRDQKSFRVFCMVGDGESNEGQIWEAVEVAAKYNLDNLIILLDRNRLQNDGTCEEIMPNGNLVDKFTAFGCQVWEIDGHDMETILDTLDEIHADHSGKPKCVVAHTVKGKGVFFMENAVEWHGMAPNDDQFARALKDIEEGF